MVCVVGFFVLFFCLFVFFLDRKVFRAKQSSFFIQENKSFFIFIIDLKLYCNFFKDIF